MNAQDYLKQYKRTLDKIEKKKELAKEYERLASSTPPIVYDRVGSNPNRNTEAPFVKWVYKKLEVEEEIKVLEEKVSHIRNEILDTICEVENETLQKILINRYIDNDAWETIASKNYLALSTVYRFHRQAVLMVEKVLLKKMIVNDS